MSKYNVRKKVMIPLSLTLVILIVAFVWACYGIRRADERLLMQQHFWSAQSVMTGLLKEEVGVLTSTAEFIAGHQLLQGAMAHRDLERLKVYSTPLLERISSRLNISHFYYYDVQGKLLLRVHSPSNVNQTHKMRGVLRIAMASGLPQAGLEVGQHGTLAQRLIYPWYRGDTLIGYIELAKDLKPMLDKLKEITRVEFTVVIDKTQLSRKHWEDHYINHHHPSDWDFIDNKVVSVTTINIPREMADQMFNRSEYGLLEKNVYIAKRHFRGALLPAIDSQAKRVGDIGMLVDVSGQEVAFYGFLKWVVGFSLFLSAALFSFAFKFLGQVGRDLTESEDRLRQESANLSEANSQLLEEIDIRTQAKGQLRNLNQTLELRVVERTREMEQKNILLEQKRRELGNALQELREKQEAILHQDKMACIGQLAAGIAHDINNPVGFIAHNLTLFERYFQRLVQFCTLQQELIKSLASAEMQTGWQKAWRDFKVEEIFREIPVMLGECQDGTTRITQIVQGLRTFIRNENPKCELTDLHQCLDTTMALQRHERGDKIRLVKEYRPIPRLYCYPQQMNQLFMNLLLNACQAIAESGEILIRTWAENKQIFIVISDSGCGIPQETLEKIYEPFFSTKPVGVGTGLGLSIVYEIVTRHHGTIAVESEVGRGTTFTMTFPFDSRKVPRDVPASVTADPGPGDPHD